MSARQDTRWYVSEPSYHGWMGYANLRYAIYPAGGLPVDYFRSQSAAQYAANLLNSSVARVDSHAVIGCRVISNA